MKILCYFIVLFFLWSSFFLVEGQAKPTSEEDQLIQVGQELLKMVLRYCWKTIFNFYKTLFQTWQGFWHLLSSRRTLILKGKFKEAKGIFLKFLMREKFRKHELCPLESPSWKWDWGMMKKRRENFFRSFGFPNIWGDRLLPLSIGTAPAQIESIRAAEITFQKVSQLSKNNELIRSSYFWLGLLSYRKNSLKQPLVIFRICVETQNLLHPAT